MCYMLYKKGTRKVLRYSIFNKLFQNNFYIFILQNYSLKHICHISLGIIAHTLIQAVIWSSSLKDCFHFIFIFTLGKNAKLQFNSCTGQIVGAGFGTVSWCIIMMKELDRNFLRDSITSSTHCSV